jgi:integrase
LQTQGGSTVKKRQFSSNQGGLYEGKAVEHRTIQPSEVATIIKCAAVLKTSDFSWDRLYMLVYLGWLTGAKVKDLIGIRLGQIVGNEFRLSGRVIETTDRLMSPVLRYLERHKIRVDAYAETFSKNEFAVFHREAGKVCEIADALDMRWAQEAFKKTVDQAGLDKPYSISSLRNLYHQMAMEVAGANERLVDYLMGNNRHERVFRHAHTHVFRRRVAEHFEKTMSDLGII